MDIKELEFLKDGIKMGLNMAEAGQKKSFGKAMEELISEGTDRDNMVTLAQKLSGAAAEARMAGIPYPVMTTAGSGTTELQSL